MALASEAAVAYLTPIIFAAVGEAVTFVTQEVKKSVKAESSTWLNELIGKLFKKFRRSHVSEKLASTALTQEQLREVHKLTLEKALQFNLSEVQGKQLADALIGELVIAGEELQHVDYPATH